MNIEKERFKRLFPHLAEEMESGKNRISIKSIRTEPEAKENTAVSTFEGYDPDIIDFLRRCDNDQQALEVINYMEKRGEITKDYAIKLRKQLKEKGVRSFGTKKSEDYYLRLAEKEK
ncbi:MAG: DUF2095 family protein [Candidatus Bathyarchaeia archaeon]